MATLSTPAVRGVLVLEQLSGARINAKYFASDLAKSPEKQLAFEKKLHAKSAVAIAAGSTEAEVMMIDNTLVVFCAGQDVLFYVLGSLSENELILHTVLEAIVETLKSVLRGHLDKNTILDNLELLLLTVDEVVDQGSILETDAAVLARRVMLRNVDGTTTGSLAAGGGSGASAAIGGGGGMGSMGGGGGMGSTSMAELTLAGALNAARDHLVRLSRS